MPNQGRVDDEAKRRLWFDYLSKINDRNLLRHRSSGLTTWAVVGALALLVFRVLDRAPLLMATPSLWPFLLFASTILADFTLYAWVNISWLHSGSKSPQTIRLQSTSERDSNLMANTGLVLFGLPLVAANVVSAGIMGQFQVSTWPFWLLAVMISCQTIVFVLQQGLRWYKSRKHGEDVPLVSLATKGPDSPFWSSLLVRIVSVLPLLVLIVPISQALPHIQTPQHTDILKWAVEITTCYLLLVFLWFRSAQQVEYRYLERLERRIVLENLQSNEIADLYIRGLLGETAREWLSRSEDHLKEIFSETQGALSDCEEGIEEIASIDPSMKYEIRARRCDVCKNMVKALDYYYGFSKSFSQHLRYILKQGGLEAHRELTNQVFDGWEEQMEELETKRKHICESCSQLLLEPGKSSTVCDVKGKLPTKTDD